MIRITVNGEERLLPAPCTIEEFLRGQPLAHGAYAVEVNRRLVPRRSHAETLLADGDQVEVVTLVGGG